MVITHPNLPDENFNSHYSNHYSSLLKSLKGGLPAALFKPRTVKGTASQATPPVLQIQSLDLLCLLCLRLEWSK